MTGSGHASTNCSPGGRARLKYTLTAGSFFESHNHTQYVNFRQFSYEFVSHFYLDSLNILEGILFCVCVISVPSQQDSNPPPLILYEAIYTLRRCLSTISWQQEEQKIFPCGEVTVGLEEEEEDKGQGEYESSNRSSEPEEPCQKTQSDMEHKKKIPLTKQTPLKKQTGLSFASRSFERDKT